MEQTGNTDTQAPGLKIARLLQAQPAYFTALRNACLGIQATRPCSNVQHKNHGTNWTKPHGTVRQWSLYNTSGNTEDTSTDHNGSVLGKRLTVQNESAQSQPLQQLVDALPHLVNLRLNLLGPGASLAPHKESIVIRTKAGGWGIKVRFHLPIISHSSQVDLNGTGYTLEPGCVYYFNNGCFHASANTGTADRLHLVWDMLLTPAVMERMFIRPAALFEPGTTAEPGTTDKPGGALAAYFRRCTNETALPTLPPLAPFPPLTDPHSREYPRDPTPEPVGEPLSVIDYFGVQ